MTLYQKYDSVNWSVFTKEQCCQMTPRSDIKQQSLWHFFEEHPPATTRTKSSDTGSVLSPDPRTEVTAVNCNVTLYNRAIHKQFHSFKCYWGQNIPGHACLHRTVACGVFSAQRQTLFPADIRSPVSCKPREWLVVRVQAPSQTVPRWHRRDSRWCASAWSASLCRTASASHEPLPTTLELPPVDVAAVELLPSTGLDERPYCQPPTKYTMMQFLHT